MAREKKRQVWYDTKTYDLAEHFIGSAPELEKLRHELAQYIQIEIESWLESEAVHLDERSKG
jgi:hypothetical protein